MEVSLSFDNAILNAAVLKEMPALWRARFITWGMPIAVFGMRFLFPILIVCFVGHTSIYEAVRLAFAAPEQYATMLAQSKSLVDVFGGMFLLMVFLKFMSEEKECYWLRTIEEKLAGLGKLESIEIIFALLLLIFIQIHAPERPLIIVYGLVGICLYTILGLFSGDSRVRTGLSAFIYLEVLDASCSFDGVIGAFVLTSNIIYIMIGLGIGALCIRSLTLYLVRGCVLKQFRYLEHGAHYAIGALAIIMLLDIFYLVPEPVTGMLGIGLIGLSLLSSIWANKDGV